MSDKIIYLDNSATTPISEEALSAYVAASRDFFGNPSSLHTLGASSEKEIRRAREILLRSLAARDYTAVFTASGSEANNLAIFGRASAKERYKKGAKIITTEGEHASVNMPLDELRKSGFKIVKIPTKNGIIDEDMLLSEMTADTILVSVMMVNNETGALYDTARVKEIMKAKAPEAVLHIDATQSYMKIPFTAKNSGADMITVSSHKIHGPKGVGALIISQNIIKTRGLSPIIFGGGQEGGLRSGTENVPGIIAFGRAIEVESSILQNTERELRALRNYLIERLKDSPILSQISITDPTASAPHILNITLPKIKSETMLHYLSAENIFVSSGSACSSNSAHISSALTAYGRDKSEADSSIRISFSRFNTKEDVDILCKALENGLARLSRMR